ncbi:MAG: hypothetical protein NW208_09420 [Bryobacter sp.]|nr:hypothetical protein [Bryobacter sp.]
MALGGIGLLDQRAQAILWAQLRTIWNFYRRPQMGGALVGTIVLVVWYLMVAGGAVGLAALMQIIPLRRFAMAETFLAFGLLVGFLYWQVVPVFLASTGMSIDLKRLLVYPVRPGQLFQIEVLLRLTTGVEVILLLLGTAIGALLHPDLPKWGVVAFPIFLVMNLYLSAGVRDLLGRLLERRGARELVVLGLVLLMVSPQMFSLLGVPPQVRQAVTSLNQFWLPWGAAASLVFGNQAALSLGVLLAWTAAAIAFGRWQFEKSLRHDSEGLRAAESERQQASRWLDGLFRLPAALLPDPLAVLLEKDLKQLARSARFRLVFFMGFTFGLVVWLPVIFGKALTTGSVVARGPISQNYLTLVSLYSVMMLSEVAVFNSLGFDRAAAQLYWIAPVGLRRVLVSKNLAAAFFVLLELALIAGVCTVLRLPVTPLKVAEAFAVTVVFLIFLAAIGNLATVHGARGINPQSAWRQSRGSKFQIWMLVIYPVLGIPLGLAYLARYAFDTNAAFFVVLAVAGALGLAFYKVALDSALEHAARNREPILSALSEGDGPIR